MRLLGLFRPVGICLRTGNLGFSFKDVINKKMPLPTTCFLKRNLWYFIKFKERFPYLFTESEESLSGLPAIAAVCLSVVGKAGSLESGTFPKVQIVYTNNIFFWTLWRKHILLLNSSQLDNWIIVFHFSFFFKPSLFLYPHGNHPQIMLEAAECSLVEDSYVSRLENAALERSHVRFMFYLLSNLSLYFTYCLALFFR